MNRIFVLIFSVFFIFNLNATAQTSRVVGLRNNTPSVYALTNARIVVSPGDVIDEGILVIRNGIIEFAGTNTKIPGDAWLIDMDGKTVYPGFIDMHVESELSEPRTGGGAFHWNPQIRSWYSAVSDFNTESKELVNLRSQGFVIAHLIPPAGIFKGSTALVSLGKEDKNMLVIRSGVAQAMGFTRSNELGGTYPTSLMGSISLIRQTFYDADWYQEAHSVFMDDPDGVKRPEYNLALESLSDEVNSLKPVFFDARDEIDFMRAYDIASEFDLDLWVMGSGHEYRRLQVFKDAKVPLVLPVAFPGVPEIEKPEDAMNISLEELRHWDFAPENPGKLSNAGINFSLTSSGSGNNSSFLKNLRIAVQRGLKEDAALAALTVTPAELLGIEKQYGSLEKGKRASFIVADGNIFNPSTKIEEVWVDGNQFEIDKPVNPDLRGEWKIESAITGLTMLEIGGNSSKLKGTIEKENKRISLKSVKYDEHRVNIIFSGDSIGMKGIIRMSAAVSDDELFGIGETADGNIINWKAERVEHFAEENEGQQRQSTMSDGKVLYPSMEYGYEDKPVMPDHMIVRNATIWTQGPQGRLENSDMLVSKGRIVEIGNNISAPRRALEIDAAGKHITPGLVDPHLHSSIKGGVNEVGNNMTPETRIKDVIEPDNVWVYRLLAGGMTTANLLHGSANPVGGQDAVIKMRWGALPEEMLLKEAMPGLKLALGENVVRNTGRYPNTRMGAEQIIKDAFQAAKDYMEEWERWESARTGFPPRKDLQMEALVDVLNGERLVHAHAYRQDEMQMLMRLAEEMGFHIASFEHTVEGYKIADVLRDHGAAAIIWTDWSSFKVEAADGILYNARILTENGVLTSLHSDNTQLSTRMNWEAGKMLATGIDEFTAMDLITINPARILGADKHVGSLEPGKHADFVIWSGHPLSGFTHAEQTWVDGRKYFDRSEDMKRREEVRQERADLIQKAIAGPPSTTGNNESADSSGQSNK